MEILSHPVVAILLLLGVLIVVHEAGHFLVGKFSGIAVEIFSIGFGPILFQFKHNETSYRLSLIPLGGFVKFFGALPSETVPKNIEGREYFRPSLGKRIATVAAGPLANFLLAIFLYAVMGMHGISQPPPIAGEIMSGSPAEKGGLEFGDLIVRIGDEKIHTWKDLRSRIVESPEQPLEIELRRNGQQKTLTIIPRQIYDANELMAKNRGQIGISPLHIQSLIRVDRGSIAADAGLQTGDQITSIAADDSPKIAIEYWRQLQREFQLLHQQKAAFVVLGVERKNSPELKQSEPREVKIPILAGQERLASLGIKGAFLTVDSTQVSLDAGFQAGDTIVSWEGEPVVDVFALRNVIEKNQKPAASIRVEREGILVPLTVTMKPVDVQRPEGKIIYYSFPTSFLAKLVEPKAVVEQYTNIFLALGYGIRETLAQSVVIATAVGGLITGDVPLQALGGPISIAKVASESVKLGWMTFISAMSLISINLGLLNLFPIPVLDGGQLVLLFTEGVRRKALSEMAIENFQKVGFVMILALVIMATYNDVGRFWASFVADMAEFIN